MGIGEIPPEDILDRTLPILDKQARGEVALGSSFDIVAAWLESGEWGSPFTVASGPRFQARPSLAASPAGDAWVAWEEGPEGWGGEYRSVDRLWNNPTDVRGPLHTWRAVRLAHDKADRYVAELRGGEPPCEPPNPDEDCLQPR